MNDQETIDQLREELERVKVQAAAMREAYEHLAGIACEFIGPDEDGQPECSCCHVQLQTVSKGHRQDCLANAILDGATAQAFSLDACRDYVPRAELDAALQRERVLREALVNVHKHLKEMIFRDGGQEWLRALDLVRSEVGLQCLKIERALLLVDALAATAPKEEA